eukprot:PhM_4_TR13962/c1_g2_i1/m.91727
MIENDTLEQPMITSPLSQHNDNDKPTRTPLPLRESIALAFIFANEAISISVLMPFVGYLVDSFHITSSKDTVGYYAGVVIAVFQLSMSISSPIWGKLSDRYGRRPAMLVGLLITAIALPAFGFSTTLWYAIVVRFLTGLFSGNMGIAKAYVAEITDKSNESVGFALLACCWGIGWMVGPMIGGYLYDPAEKYPASFSKSGMWGQYPALLPCLMSSCYSFAVFAVSFMYLPETNPRAKKLPCLCLEDPFGRANATRQRTSTSCSLNLNEEIENSHHKNNNNDIPPANENGQSEENGDEVNDMDALTLVRQYPTFAKATLIYILFAFVDIIFYEDFGLWAIASTRGGGLDMSSDRLGLVMIWNGLFSIPTPWTMPYVRKHMHALPLHRVSTCVYALLMFLLPHVHAIPNDSFAQNAVLVLWMFFRATFASFVYSLNFTFLTNTAPPEHMALAHGVAQMCACVARTVSPAVAGAVLAWSMDNSLVYPLNFHFMFIVSSLLLLGMVGVTFFMTPEMVERGSAVAQQQQQQQQNEPNSRRSISINLKTDESEEGIV